MDSLACGSLVLTDELPSDHYCHIVLQTLVVVYRPPAGNNSINMSEELPVLQAFVGETGYMLLCFKEIVPLRAPPPPPPPS